MISLQELCDTYECPSTRASRFIEPLNDAMDTYGIDTKLRIAHFLAQVGHESGRLVYVREIASGDAYDMRADLGNTEKAAIQAAAFVRSTPGRYFRGRGLIQVTGYYNYLKCGEALGIDLIKNPTLLEMPKYAALSAAWFWNSRKLNELADEDLLTKITKRINGGQNGIDDRRAILVKAKKVLGI